MCRRLLVVTIVATAIASLSPVVSSAGGWDTLNFPADRRADRSRRVPVRGRIADVHGSRSSFGPVHHRFLRPPVHALNRRVPRVGVDHDRPHSLRGGTPRSSRPATDATLGAEERGSEGRPRVEGAPSHLGSRAGRPSGAPTRRCVSGRRIGVGLRSHASREGRVGTLVALAAGGAPRGRRRRADRPAAPNEDSQRYL